MPSEEYSAPVSNCASTTSVPILDSTDVFIFSTSEGIWGGSQIFNESLCRYLEAQGVSTALASPSPELYSCRTLKIDSIMNRSDRVAVALKFARTMRRIRARAVILDDLSGLWLAPIFRLFGLKVFSILHLQLKRRDKWGFGHNWLTFHLLRLSSRVVHHTFSVGKANIEVFPVPVEFIGNVVGDSFFDRTSGQDKLFDLGTVSRLSPEKNLSLLIHLVANLNKSSMRPISCAIVGDGPDKESLVRLSEQLDLSKLVTFLPWSPRSEVPFVLDKIRCFAMTSRHEGFATTILESHARGIPAVVTKTSGFSPEFVVGYGNSTGLVFDEKDVENYSVLDSILTLIDAHQSFDSLCVSKAARFSESIVFGRISRQLRERLG